MQIKKIANKREKKKKNERTFTFENKCLIRRNKLNMEPVAIWQFVYMQILFASFYNNGTDVYKKKNTSVRSIIAVVYMGSSVFVLSNPPGDVAADVKRPARLQISQLYSSESHGG